jgi:hypothetical protein
MTARHFLTAIGALILLGAVSLWLLSGGEEAPVVAAPAAKLEEPAAPPRTPAEAVSPGEARLLAELEEARGAYQSMRTAFGSAGGRVATGERRLGEALRKLPGGRSWTITCRGELCEVGADGPTVEWQRALQDAPSLRAISQRLAVDPDGGDAPAYVVLAPAGAARGHDVLGQIETEFLDSSEARYCLSSVGASGALEYELSVDSSGYSYRTSTDLPRDVVECVNDVLGDILRLAPVPPQGATLASRTFGLCR